MIDLDVLPGEARGEHPSDLDLDRLVAGVLPADDAHAFEAHAAGCDQCAARLALLREDPRDLNDAKVMAGVRRALDAEAPRPWLRWLLSGLAVAAAATAVMLFVGRAGTDDAPGVRLKGDLHLEVIRQVGANSTAVLPGEAISPDQALRFAVSLPAPARVAIFGVEPDGAFYRAWPLPDEQVETARPAGQAQLLPGAVYLDGAAGTERLYLVACPDVEPVCIGQGAGKPPACPEACAHTAFEFVRPAR